jgi:hypothetical protein
MPASSRAARVATLRPLVRLPVPLSRLSYLLLHSFLDKVEALEAASGVRRLCVGHEERV